MIGPGGRFARTDAAAIAAAGLAAAGLAVAAGALGDAAVPARLSGIDRIVVGLAHVQTAQLTALAVGLGVLAAAFAGGARVGGWGEVLSRLGAGIAAGGFGLSAAIVVAVTIVALHQRFDGVLVTGSSVLGEWLRQAVAGVGFATVFAVEAVALADVRPGPVHEPETEHGADAAPPDEPAGEQPAAGVPRAAPQRPSPILAEPAPAGAPLAAQAEEIYRRRLAFSPRAAEARRLAAEVTRLELEGRPAEASRLIDQLDAM